MSEQSHLHLITEDEDNELNHFGSDERRHDQRRLAKDRREMIRFELDKDDRRHGKDRRSNVTHWGTDQPV